MFYKSFLYIIIILTVIFTLVLCSIKPKMHTAVMIYDSQYKVEEVSSTKVEKKTTKQVTTPVKQKTETKKVFQTQQKQEKTTTQQPTIKTTTKTANTVKEKVEVKDKVAKVENKVVNTTIPKVEKTVQKVETTEKIQPKISVEEQKDVIEEIEWNKWRSNIQNQVMRDVKLPMLPNGTIFKFSFDVDKYGRITNIQAWSMTPNYTPYAVQYIAPVIRSYQGHSILNFPQGSQRINTTVTGQWKISTSQKYSTSSNFHDIESVQKGN